MSVTVTYAEVASPTGSMVALDTCITLLPPTPALLQALHSHAARDRTTAAVPAESGRMLVSCLAGSQPG